MKVNQPSVELFTPVTVTFETEAELAFFIRVLGVTTHSVSKKFGVKSKEHFNTYMELSDIITDDKIQKYPTLTLLTNY